MHVAVPCAFHITTGGTALHVLFICDRPIEQFTGNNCLEIVWSFMNWNKCGGKASRKSIGLKRLELYERNEIISPNINFSNGSDDKQPHEIVSNQICITRRSNVAFFLLLPIFLWRMHDIAWIQTH